MKVQSIGTYNSNVNFRGESKKEASEAKYENPIDRKKEQQLSILSTVGASAAAGAVATGIATCFIDSTKSHRMAKAGGVGLAVGLAAMALTLPAKLYNTKVSSFTREKETEVFSRDRDVRANLLDQINTQTKQEEVPLEQKIGNYATMQMATNGAGMIVKQGV